MHKHKAPFFKSAVQSKDYYVIQIQIGTYRHCHFGVVFAMKLIDAEKNQCWHSGIECFRTALWL